MHIKRQDPKFPHNELMLFLKYHSYLQAKTAPLESGILKNSAAVFFTDKTPTSTVNKIKYRKIQQRKQIALSLIFINLSDRNFVTGAEYILIDFRKPPKAIWFLPQEFLQNIIPTISKSFSLYRKLLNRQSLGDFTKVEGTQMEIFNFLWLIWVNSLPLTPTKHD